MNPFALLSAALEGLSWRSEKQTLFKEHAMEFTAALMLFCVLIVTPLWLFAPVEYLSLGITGLILASAAAGSLAAFLIAKGLRHISMRLASPFIGLAPLIAAGTGFYFGEQLSAIEWLAVVIISIGLFSIEGQARWLEPIKHMNRLKYVWFLIMGLFMFTAGVFIDLQVVGSHAHEYYGLPIIAYLPLYFFFCATILVVMMLIFHDGFRGIGKGMERNIKPLFLVAILVVLSKAAMLHSLTFTGAVASLAVAVQKTSWAIGSAVEGDFWHGEGVLRRIFALVLVIAGAAILML